MKNSSLSAEDKTIVFFIVLFIVAALFAIYAIYDNQKHEESLKKEAEAVVAAPVVEAPPPPYEFEAQETINSMPKKSYEESVKDAWAEADKANAIIDNAQDEILRDYKKQAVEHIVSNRAGRAKVDTFILKNGKTVSCITTASDYGKAIDCH